MGDFERWDNVAPSRHSAPGEIEAMYRREERNRGLRRLIGWTIVILAGCGYALHWIFTH